MVKLGAEGAGLEGDPVAGSGLIEDRLQVVLDGVPGEGHLAGYCPGVAASSQQAEQLVFADGQAVSAGEQVEAVGSGCFLGSVGDVRYRW